MATSGINLSQANATSGTGIDVTSTVDQILNAERAPEQLWKQQQSLLQTQSSILTSLNNGLNSLQDKIRALSDSFGVLGAKNASSSLSGVLTASAQSSAVDGTHLIVVSSLATTGTAYSDPVTDANTTFASGVITLNVGTATQNIQIDNTNNTLSTLASSINTQNLGITASVVSDASGSRLALVSSTTGNAGDLTVTGNTSGLGMHKGTPGQNASLTIDGVPFSSASNTVTGAIAGVTLNLNGSAPATEVTVTVGPDQSGVKQALQDFVAAYNVVMTTINGQFAVNSSNSQGPLASDSSLRFLQSNLLTDVTHSVSGNNSFVNLASLGINMANDGTLSVDDSKLSSAVNNHYADLQSFLQTATTGFASNFATDLGNLTDSTQGLLNVDLAQNAIQQKELTRQINDFEDRLAVRQQQLIAQYSRVDTMLRQYPLIMQQLNSQLASLSSLSQ